MTTSGLPFDDFRELVRQMPGVDQPAGKQVRDWLSSPDGTTTLGRASAVAEWLAAATGRLPPRTVKPMVALFAATHQVSRRLGIYDPVGHEHARVEALASGAHPVSHLCAADGLGLNVFDLALDLPVNDFTQAPALDEKSCAATMAFGMEAMATGADLVCLGASGRAPDLSAYAVLQALGHEPEMHGVEGSPPIAALLEEALATHRGHLQDPLEILRRLGGRETAAIAGAILAARTQKVAIILDGLSATAAAAVLNRLEPRALDHCAFADVVDAHHRAIVERLGGRPLLEFGIRGHDGAASAMATGLVKSAGELAAGIAEVRRRAQ